MMVSQMLGMCYPLAASVVLLVYVKPYRRALLRLVGVKEGHSDIVSHATGSGFTAPLHSVSAFNRVHCSNTGMEERARRHKSVA